jgi:SAM-dependent methyltransferase
MVTPRRLVFGEVADLYDRHRPSYPSALVDDLIELAGVAPGERVLEVGAGTGKATGLFATRGIAVLAVEPSPGMAEVARRNCVAYPRVEIVQSDFEHWEPAGQRFPLLYSAQAWHWIDPQLRYLRARAALRDGGLLAAFWNRPAWGRSAERQALLAAYRTIAPDMPTDGPLHPANPSPEGEDDWPGEIAGVTGFADPTVRRYPWRVDYTADEYVGLLGTLSEFRLLDEEPRGRLLRAVGEIVGEHGGRLTMPMVTRVNLARAA